MKLFTTLLLSSTLAFSLNVQEIVQKSDTIRNVGGSMVERGHIVEYQNARQVDSMTIDIYAQEFEDDFKILVQILSPKKDKGKLILRFGNKIWLYDGGLCPYLDNSLKDKNTYNIESYFQ